MKEIASALVKAQKARNVASESRLLKTFADQMLPLRRVNQKTAQAMPQRFLSKLIFGASECWTWRGYVDSLGYGRFHYAGETKAHRVSFLYFNGPLLAGKMVLHKCDNRQCVNPDHLYLGTQTDNMRDMTNRGRGVAPRLCGEANPRAKLTGAQVEEIRASVAAGSTQRAMCVRFGVTPMTASRIVRNQSWN